MNRRPDARTAGHRGSSAGQSEISPLVRKGIKQFGFVISLKVKRPKMATFPWHPRKMLPF